MSVHPLRLLALLLLSTSVAFGAFQFLKPQTITYIQLRESVEKESGQLLQADDLEPLTLTLGNIFQASVSPIPGLIPWEQLPRYVGLPFSHQVKGGRPLLASDLETSNQPQQEKMLDASMTGMSIPVNNIAGVTPHLAKGERVHVYASFENEVGAHSGLLLQNMPIIGVQREMEGDRPNLVAVTLSLTRSEAVLLTHALHYGQIRLGLAAGLDEQKSGIGDITFANDLMKTKKRWEFPKENRE
jgi:pilus assembly protein CpaB